MQPAAARPLPAVTRQQALATSFASGLYTGLRGSPVGGGPVRRTAAVEGKGMYTLVDTENQHLLRRRRILAAHPEVKRLMGPYAPSALWIVGLVALQIAVAVLAGGLPWWAILIAAYVFGAFVSHALYVLMHECTHDLVLDSRRGNRLLGIVCDLALSVPSAMAFRKYHLMHHKHLGEYVLDPDIVSETEAKLVGSSMLRKALWMLFLSVSQALRPNKLKRMVGMPMYDRWIVANMAVIIVADVLIWLYAGPGAFFYLLASTFFALGLHPLGGRWIQEHYAADAGQDTYSYYGPLNRVCFNMGYHVEHHDFANVPWNNLPKLKRAAPEHYEGLTSYRSWTAVVWRFVTDPRMSCYSRVVHPPRVAATQGEA